MTSSSLFLRLSEADLTLVNRYHGTLTAGAESLAHDFYAYLLAHPGTAAVFGDFSPEHPGIGSRTGLLNPENGILIN